MNSDSNIICLPLSKSIGARFLTASFFAGKLKNAEPTTDSDDLMVIHQALSILDSSFKGNAETAANEPPKIDVHASGTAFRIMAAVIASSEGAEFILTGTPRLCSRPMNMLIDVLRAAGADITPLGTGNTGPYLIKGRKLKGGRFEIRGDVSSQFITALMLVAPQWEGGINLHFTTPLVSFPYIEMTAGLMRKFGVKVCLAHDHVEVGEGKYVAPANFNIEADWSAAGFFYEAAALCGLSMELKGLLPPGESLQGDADTATIFRKMGISSDFRDETDIIKRSGQLPGNLSLDMTHNPDLVPALAVACAFNGVKFRFSGVHNLRVKECDRLAAIQAELRKFGYAVDAGDDYMEWAGETCPAAVNPTVETYDDHRIAMAFAMAALKLNSIRIANPGVVAKSFAGFWGELHKINLDCHAGGDEMLVTMASNKIE